MAENFNFFCMIITKFVIVMKDFTANQFIWGTQGESFCYKSSLQIHSPKWR